MPQALFDPASMRGSFFTPKTSFGKLEINMITHGYTPCRKSFAGGAVNDHRGKGVRKTL
jgi:hypothetical protein